jgi:predicted dinucleotide-binding enzyme
MKIAIIGSGNVGGALAKALRRAGHAVTFGARAPDTARTDEKSISEAVGHADAAILAIPFAAAADVIAAAAKVFKTFNQTGFENMADATVFKTPPVMFVAGDDEAAKPLVLQLVSDAGFEAIDAGKLHAARLIEPLAMLWIEQGRFRGMGPDFAFALQRKV